MRTDEDSYDTRIAIQPESELEQQLLAELFARMKAIDDSPPHPEYVGSSNVFYTLDLGMYDGLDLDLWEEAEVGVDGGGKIDPAPGSRALVVIHQEESYSQPTEQEIDEAVESLIEGEDEDNEFTEDVVELAHDVDSLDLDALDEPEIENLARRVSTAPINISLPLGAERDELVEGLRDFVGVVEVRLEDEIDQIRNDADDVEQPFDED